MSYLSSNLNALIGAVKRAAAPANRDFSEIEKLQTSVRGLNEFAISSIRRVAGNLRQELSKIRPGFAFAEDNKPQPAGPHFIVCTLDGVINFSRGIPELAVSVATCENGQITTAVIYNPATEECYFAEKGNGAYKEGFRSHERLRVSLRKDIADSMISVQSQMDDQGQTSDQACQDIRNKIIAEQGFVRNFGCTALDLARVAAGKMDAAVSAHNTMSQIAAGILLVKESGGLVLEMHQKDPRSEDIASVLASGNVVASNANIGKKVIELINK